MKGDMRMSLNLIGDFNPNGQLGFGGNHSQAMASTDGKAVLYVFKPYLANMDDIAIRSMTYGFDDNFLEGTREIIDVAKRGAAQGSTLIQELGSAVNLNDNMMSAFSPTMMIRMAHLADKWRFVLILTESANDDLNIGNSFVAKPSNSSIRRIYNGFFEDEPFNPLTFASQRRTLNPNSFMVFTHKTIVGMATTHGRMGPTTMLNTHDSEEIIRPQVTSALAIPASEQTNELFVMTPQNCMAGIASDDQGFSYSVPGAYSNVTNDSSSTVVPDFLEQPKHNIGHVVRGLIHHQEEIIARTAISHNRLDSFFGDAFLDDGLARGQLGRHLGVSRSRRQSVFDLDVDDKISTSTLNDMVRGDLDIVCCDIDRPDYYETADQRIESMCHQYSALMAAVICPILNSAGLLEMSFQYEVMQRAGRKEDRFITRDAVPCYTIHPNEVVRMAKAVEFELVSGVLRTIFESKGDFVIAVNASTTGTTAVRLHLVGQGHHSPVDFEVPSFMGGIISPLIGGRIANAYNSEAIESLYGITSGMASPGVQFNDDDLAFQNAANHFTLDAELDYD